MPHLGPSCRRTQILDAACALLRCQGPSKTTIAQIARKAGVGVGTVYLEFRSKDAIIAALSRRRHDTVIDAMRRAAGEPLADEACAERCGDADDTAAATDAATRLRAVFDVRTARLLELADDGSHSATLLHNNECAVVSAACAEFSRAQHELLVRAVERGVAEGAFAARDVDATARALVLAYSSFEPPALLQMLRQRDRATIQHDLSAIHDLVLRGLVVRA